MRILAAHQPNFIPWIPFFSKMEWCDVFILLINVQFEKNGWQNRCQMNGKYWTKPVKQGTETIKSKHYVNGHNLASLNTAWVVAIAKTLDIDTKKIELDYDTELRGTERIIDICKKHNATHYLTNPDAASKYLDVELMEQNGIKVIHHQTEYKIHTFEAFSRWGIEKTVELIQREKRKWKASLNSSAT